jgi:integrase
VDRLGRGESISQGTVLYIYKVLKNVLIRATKWRIILKNPIDGISKPKVEQEKMLYLDGKEAHLLIEALSKEPVAWRMFFLSSLLGGFSTGRAIGLRMAFCEL